MDNNKSSLKKKHYNNLISFMITGLCPSCGEVSILNGYLNIKEHCPNCMLKIKIEDIGDGATWFSMFITSIIVFIGALILELYFHPELWVHILVWIPIVLILVLLTLRPIKLLFIYFAYRNRNTD